MPLGAVLFIAIGVLLAAGGVVFLSEATAGVGLIALACFSGIIARMVQAESALRQPTRHTLQQAVTLTPEQSARIERNKKQQTITAIIAVAVIGTLWLALQIFG